MVRARVCVSELLVQRSVTPSSGLNSFIPKCNNTADQGVDYLFMHVSIQSVITSVIYNL